VEAGAAQALMGAVQCVQWHGGGGVVRAGGRTICACLESDRAAWLGNRPGWGRPGWGNWAGGYWPDMGWLGCGRGRAGLACGSSTTVILLRRCC
jgi:hypothetical protein